MKIVHVVEAFEGGINEFVNTLTSLLNEHDHYVIYSKRKYNLKSPFGQNVKLVEWPNAQREISLIKDMKAAFSLLKILKKIDYKTLHLHSSKAGFLGRFISPFLKNKFMIYTPNGAPFNRLDVSLFKRCFYRLLEKIGNKFAGVVVCVSKSESMDYERIGIKSYYINNGVTIKPQNDKVKYDGELVIATAGRITPQKNPVMFNQIASSFITDSKIRFKWIGDGELVKELTSRNITITGWKTKQETLAELKDIHLYLSTALWEGLPFAVLDAMNLSKPLLLSECTGNVDLVNQGENGFLFRDAKKASDLIKDFTDNPDKLIEMGNKSRDLLSQKFDAHRMAEQYEVAYKGEFSELNQLSR